MKNIVMIIVSALLGIITLTIVMTVSGRMNRSMELQSGLPSVIEETVANMAVNKNYSINNANEYAADLAENLSLQLDADSDITVEVMKADKEKGILSVRVTADFHHPNGNPGKVQCERTVVLNKVDSPEPKQYQVQFFLGDKEYKIYTLYENDAITAPCAPKAEGMQFAGWKDANGYLADFSLPVEQDMTYYADWQ